MQYLVQMKLAAYSRPKTPQEGAAFMAGYIFPSLEMCKRLEAERKILAGGPMSGTIGIALIVQAETAQEFDELIESLPVWPQMATGAPSLSNSCAAASPIPLLPPVIRIFLSVSLPIVVISSG